MKAPWIKELKTIGIDAVVRVKHEYLGIVKEATAFFKSRKTDKECTVNPKNNKKVKITAWDEDNFEMTGLYDTVMFIRFIGKMSHGDKIEIKEVSIVTTNKYIAAETLWNIIHSRWYIENNGLKDEWHLNHYFLHSPTGVEAVLIFMVIAYLFLKSGLLILGYKWRFF